AAQALRPGQQLSTNPAMGSVSVPEEVAWSRDREKHLALLKEMLAFGENVSKRIESVEMRHRSNLVGLIPEGTLVFASLPNLTQSFAESYAMFKQRVSENGQLAGWWQQNMRARNGGLSIDEIVGRVTRLGAYLGPELVLALPQDL